jgi:hypothetical protein
MVYFCAEFDFLQNPDHYDLWGRLGSPSMIAFRFMFFGSSQLLLRAGYSDPTLVA